MRKGWKAPAGFSVSLSASRDPIFYTKLFSFTFSSLKKLTRFLRCSDMKAFLGCILISGFSLALILKKTADFQKNQIEFIAKYFLEKKVNSVTSTLCPDIGEWLFIYLFFFLFNKRPNTFHSLILNSLLKIKLVVRNSFEPRDQ